MRQSEFHVLPWHFYATQINYVPMSAYYGLLMLRGSQILMQLLNATANQKFITPPISIDHPWIPRWVVARWSCDVCGFVMYGLDSAYGGMAVLQTRHSFMIPLILLQLPHRCPLRRLDTQEMNLWLRMSRISSWIILNLPAGLSFSACDVSMTTVDTLPHLRTRIEKYLHAGRVEGLVYVPVENSGVFAAGVDYETIKNHILLRWFTNLPYSFNKYKDKKAFFWVRNPAIFLKAVKW